MDFLSIMIQKNHQFCWMEKFEDRMIAFFLTSVYEDAFSVVTVNERSLRGQGIGTMSFRLIKKLAESLRCDSICGFRRPLEYFETEEERKKLYRFYDKLGFKQSAESDKIRFVLRK